MNHGENAGHDWVADLAEFLRAEPGVTAVRIDPAAHRWSIASLGAVPVPGLEEKLAARLRKRRPRIKTRPGKAAIARRLDAKRKQGEKKRRRQNFD